MSIIFADDTNLFLSNSDIYELFSNMNKELNHISNWFKCNKLTLNIDKTKWILFHSLAKKRFLPNNLPKLFIDKIEIKKESVTRFLGIYIDKNITWKYHIDFISTKLAKSIGILYKVRYYLNKQNLIQLYYSFIHSYINYANIVWGSTSKSKLRNLYHRQKHAMRLICFENRFSHSNILFKNVKALNVYELNVYNILCFMFRCKSEQPLFIFKDLFTHKAINKYTLRNNNLIIEPFCQTKFNQFCINYRAPYLWNKIVVPNFDLSISFSVFKTKLKNFILSTDNIYKYF